MAYEALKALNYARWQKATIIPGRRAGLEKTAKLLIANKAKYQRVEAGCGVPWWFVAVIHVRESDGDFNTQLAQGDPLGRVSVHVPKGRGPFLDHPGAQWSAWERGCFDALTDCAPHAARNPDKSLAGWLLYFELYNGLGYANRGIPSPYLWSGTDQYKSGKYVADGVFDGAAVDTQPGCTALLKVMMEMDSTIQPDVPVHTAPPTVPVTPLPPLPPKPPRVPPMTTPAPATMPAMPPALLSFAKTTFPLLDQFFPTWEPELVAFVTTNQGAVVGQALDFVLKAARSVLQAQLGVTVTTGGTTTAIPLLSTALPPLPLIAEVETIAQNLLSKIAEMKVAAPETVAQ